ncbi:hypothetical protein ACP4OV_012160 [Aristida adscensionis]
MHHKRRNRKFVSLAMLIGTYYYHMYMDKAKRREPKETGIEWVQSNLASSTSCYNMFRMIRGTFNRLHDVLVESYGLKSSSNMSSVEALAMFLWIVGAPQSVRQAENRFVRSTEIVSRKFEHVLSCVSKLAADIIKPVDPEFRSVHPRLQGPLFSPFFNDCIGAIDGTHVQVVVPKSKVMQYTDRHGYTSQNVMAVCDFNMRFTFVLAGWPGSVHDMRVFNDAMHKYGHKFPHQKYYLVDSGYANRQGYLAPYKGTKYHLPEFRMGPVPRGKKELFNHRHSSLTNVIERTFGVLKMKWRILEKVPSFPVRKQSKIIIAYMPLHNFIRENAAMDRDFDLCDIEEVEALYDPLDTVSVNQNAEGQEDDKDMNAFREQIATALYNSVQS